MANGQMLAAGTMCKGLAWKIQWVEFTADVQLLPLGGCEMVLGIQWLRLLGDIK